MKAHDCVLGGYELHFRQQPQQAQAIGNLASLKRPIEPPPIVELRLKSPPSRDSLGEKISGLRWPDARKPEGRAWRSRAQNPNYFCHATVIPASGDGSEAEGKALVGTSVSSLYLLPDVDQTAAAVFTFPDCSVRDRGWFKLKLTLFELVHKNVFWCCAIVSSAFYVFGELDYPGPLATTDLSRVLARSGHKIRVPKRIRLKRVQTEDAPPVSTPITSPSVSSSTSSTQLQDPAPSLLQSKSHRASERQRALMFPPIATRPSFRPYPQHRPSSSRHSASSSPAHSAKQEGVAQDGSLHYDYALTISGAQQLSAGAGVGTVHDWNERPLSCNAAQISHLPVRSKHSDTLKVTPPITSLAPTRLPSTSVALRSTLVGWSTSTEHRPRLLATLPDPSRRFGAVDGPLTLPPILDSPRRQSLPKSPDSAVGEVTRPGASAQMRIDRLLS